MRRATAFAACALLGWFGVRLVNDPATVPPHPAVTRVPADTSTSVAPTTTTPADAHVPLVRASRHMSAPRPAVAVPRGDCNAWGWVRTRTESDACWRESVSRWTDWDADHMLRILYCESKGDPWSLGAGRYVGLLQIDGARNLQGNGPAQLELGHSIWQRQGYGAWPVCQYR